MLLFLLLPLLPLHDVQGCNNLYFSQLGDIYYATVQQTDQPRLPTTVFNNTVQVTDIPLLCPANTSESSFLTTSWCDYCNTSQFDHPILLPNPNYTCSFTTVVDLCTLDNGLLENETFCVNADINSTTATVTTSEVLQGRVLLKILDIEEIGEEKVYRVLGHQAGAYLGLYVLLCVLLNRRENHRLFARRKNKSKNSNDNNKQK